VDSKTETYIWPMNLSCAAALYINS